MSQADSYEFKERAGIRRFDGGFDCIESNQLALVDINQRAAVEQAGQAGRLQQVTAERTIRPCSDENEALITELKAEREQIKELWMAEKEPAQEALLHDKWIELSQQIIAARGRSN